MKKSKYIMGMILSVSLFMVTLTACASKETGAEAKGVESVMEEEKVVEEEATVEVAEHESIPEAVSAPTVVETVEEATEEIPVYEGIDMESTLPGEEWIKTFDGIITVPKVVILNDETGRKQIVEDGDKVTINPDTDYIGVYLPGDAEMAEHIHGIALNDTVMTEKYWLMYLDSEMTREIGKQDAVVYVIVDGKEIEIPFKVKPE